MENTPEKLVHIDSTHWAKYIPAIVSTVFFVALAVVLLVIAFMLRQSFYQIAIALLMIAQLFLVFAHHYCFHKLLSEEQFDIILTTERIIYFDDCLLSCDDEHEIPIVKVTAVEVRQRGVMQNMLNYGTLWLDRGGDTKDLQRSIPFVAKPDEVAEKVSALVRGKYY